jgi:hypothetical protein
MKAQPHHHQDRQQQEGDDPEQAGREQGISERRGSASSVTHRRIKAVDTVER